MKKIIFIFFLAASASAKDIRVLTSDTDAYMSIHADAGGGAFWVFSRAGIEIFSRDGSQSIKQLLANDICPCNRRDEECGTCDRNSDATCYFERAPKCDFKDATTDGMKYVFASNLANSERHTLEVFSVTSGRHLSSQPTCQSPYRVVYALQREEAWVHCWNRVQPDVNRYDGHIDVMSTNVFGVDHSEVNLWDVPVPQPQPSPAPGSPVLTPTTPSIVFGFPGLSILDTSIPNIAVATSLATPAIFIINVHTRTVTSTIPLGNGCQGAYRAAFSPVNKHIYVQCTVCCSCGADDDDVDSVKESDLGKRCGRVGAWKNIPGYVNVTTASGTLETVYGFCGEECYGSKRDFGVLEVDVLNEKVIGRQSPSCEECNGDDCWKCYGAVPRANPLGDVILLLSSNGRHVDFLRPGGQGQLSHRIMHKRLDFYDDSIKEKGGQTTQNMDVAFLEDGGSLKVAIFTTTVAYEAAIVDMTTLNQKTASNKILELWTSDENYYGDPGSASGYYDDIHKVDCDLERYCFLYLKKPGTLHVIDVVGTRGQINDAKVVRTMQIIGLQHVLYAQNYRAPTPSDIETALSESAASARDAEDSARQAKAYAKQAKETEEKAKKLVEIAQNQPPPPPLPPSPPPPLPSLSTLDESEGAQANSAEQASSSMSGTTVAAIVMSSLALFASFSTMAIHAFLWQKAQAVVHFKQSGVKAKRARAEMTSSSAMNSL